MDMVVIRTLITVAAFVTFLGIVAWAWSGSRRQQFEEAARLPLEETEGEEQAGVSGGRGAGK